MTLRACGEVFPAEQTSGSMVTLPGVIDCGTSTGNNLRSFFLPVVEMRQHCVLVIHIVIQHGDAGLGNVNCWV